ncbi:MAG: Gfo/Idh/MocA family oxidoreductase [Caldilineaceae bacterium]
MTEVYKVAVIGAGMGGKLSMKAAAASARFQLVAVADWREEARHEAEALYPGIRTFATHEALFAAMPLDVVCVSTWPPSHLAVTEAALAMPLKGILVEKPLADNTADGAQLLRLIQARRLPMVTPHGLLVAEHVQQLMARVQQGEIGELKLIEIQCSGWDIINAGIHWLNFVVVLTQQAPVDYVLATCDATTRTYRDGMQVETLAVTYIQFQSGLRVVMNTGDYVKSSEPGENTLFRLIGTQGTLDFYAWKPCYRLCNGAFPQGKLIEVDPGPRSAHQKYLELLADQIEGNTPDYRWPQASLAALELCEAAYRSNHDRVAVPLPFAPFKSPQAQVWEPGKPYSGQGGGRDGRRLPQ